MFTNYIVNAGLMRYSQNYSDSVQDNKALYNEKLEKLSALLQFTKIA